QGSSDQSRSERCPIVEVDAGPQPKSPALIAGLCLPRKCQSRFDATKVVDEDQRVKQQVCKIASSDRVRLGGIERIKGRGGYSRHDMNVAAILGTRGSSRVSAQEQATDHKQLPNDMPHISPSVDFVKLPSRRCRWIRSKAMSRSHSFLWEGWLQRDRDPGTRRRESYPAQFRRLNWWRGSASLIHSSSQWRQCHCPN